MPVLPSAVLLRLVLLAAPPDTSALSAPLGCKTGTSHLELTEDTPGEAHTVCIHPGLPTSFFFDAKLANVELAGRERFRVIEGEAGLTLVPTRALAQGERVPVTVTFQEGVAPVGVIFTLLVHPSEAARLVEVTRQQRTLASYREGEQQARAEARQCRQEKARLEAECNGQGGLLDLLARGLLGEEGIAGKDITESVASRPGNTLTSLMARSYRSGTAHMNGRREVVRLAVVQRLRNNGNTPWTPAGALLVGRQGVEWKALGVWSPKSIPPGHTGLLGVEVEVTVEAARGTFTLKMESQEAGGGDALFDGVTFP